MDATNELRPGLTGISTLGITGIGGFIGAQIAQRAQALDVGVRGIDTDPRAVARCCEQGVNARSGSITDNEAVTWLADGVDAIVHTAARINESGKKDEFRRVNVGGTEAVARAAAAAGVRRFVHLSSVMVYGFDFPPNVAEDGPLHGHGNPYCTTKIESEQAVLRVHGGDNGLEVVVLRPGDVYGPRSRPWVVRPLQLMRRGLFFLPDGGRKALNHLHVDNMVDAIVLALGRDVGGEIFNVTDGQPTTCADYFGRLAQLVGIQGVRTLPAWLLRSMIGTVERVHEILGREPPAAAQAIEFLRRPHHYSIDRARERLGYRPRVELAEGMADVGRWIQSAEGQAAITPQKD